MSATRNISSSLVITLLIIFLTVSAPVSAAVDARCERAFTVGTKDVLRGEGYGGDTPVRIDVEQPGIVTLEVTAAMDGSIEPKLGTLPCGATAPGGVATLLSRSAKRMILAVHAPGTCFLRVAAQDPRQSLGSFRLTTGFSPRVPTVASLYTHVVNPDPDKKNFAEDPVADTHVVNPDPDSPLSATAAELDTHVVNPDPDGRSPAGCWSPIEDDHGDTAGCATAVQLNSTITGTVDNAWGDDEDVFVFDLTTLCTLHIETTGEVDAVGALYDQAGHRLTMANGDDQDAGLRMAATLVPGRYMLRLGGRLGSEGSYAISVWTSEW